MCQVGGDIKVEIPRFLVGQCYNPSVHNLKVNVQHGDFLSTPIQVPAEGEGPNSCMVFIKEVHCVSVVGIQTPNTSSIYLR